MEDKAALHENCCTAWHLGLWWEAAATTATRMGGPETPEGVSALAGEPARCESALRCAAVLGVAGGAPGWRRCAAGVAGTGVGRPSVESAPKRQIVLHKRR